jgi:hexosaminidase
MKVCCIVVVCLWLVNDCRAQIDNTNNLMPVPYKIENAGGKYEIGPQLHVSVIGTCHKRMYAAATRFIRRLGEQTGIFYDRQGIVTTADRDSADQLVIKIKRPGKLILNEDERYSIAVSSTQVVVNAETDIGGIHALETLLQLVSTDENGYYFPAIQIDDKPRFAWRGLLLDVALHFMPVDVVKRTLDGMAAVKMNVLHLHLSNDQGFRVESKVFPRLNQVSSEGKYYTQQDVKEIVRYAGEQGIRVVPEFVVPAHTTAILTAYPELASLKKKYTLERYFGVFDPVMDPTNPQVYVFLDKLFAEMMTLFPDRYFHIGGDENTGKHWQQSEHIQQYMKEKGMKDYMELQTEFNRKIQPIITKHGKTMMGWDEILQPGVPKDVVIQSWRGRDAFFESIKKGYRAILSHGYYIDLIQHADTHYLNDPIPDSVQLTREETARVLGGEATMWSELVTPETVDSRIWPRLAPIAERLWSPASVKDVTSMYARMKIVSRELESLGLTHISYRGPFMRRLANGYDTAPLEVLLDVIEPLKIYERNAGDTMYTVFSPMTKIADAAVPDPELPREFNRLVDEYLMLHSDSLRKTIVQQLQVWKDNHARFMMLVNKSPVLKEAEILSLNLSKIAAAGLDAVMHLHEGNDVSKEWLAEQLEILENAKVSGGRCELQVITPIQKLVEAASDENARVIPSFENTCILIRKTLPNAK